MPGSGSYTENHSFTLTSVAHPHCCPQHTRAYNTHPHTCTHTHIHLLHGDIVPAHSLTHTQRPCRHTHVHSCTPTHASRELLIHVPTAQPLLSCPGQGHPLDTDPSCDPSYISPGFLSHVCMNARRHTHTLTWRRGAALPCTPPIIQVCEVCVVGGVCLVCCLSVDAPFTHSHRLCLLLPGLEMLSPVQFTPGIMYVWSVGSVFSFL